jgi:hypothetical protein
VHPAAPHPCALLAAAPAATQAGLGHLAAPGRSALSCCSARVVVAARCWPPSQPGRSSTRSSASGGWRRASARRWCPVTAARARHRCSSTCWRSRGPGVTSPSRRQAALRLPTSAPPSAAV